MQNNKIRITMKKTMNNGQMDMFNELVEKKIRMQDRSTGKLQDMR